MFREGMLEYNMILISTPFNILKFWKNLSLNMSYTTRKQFKFTPNRCLDPKLT